MPSAELSRRVEKVIGERRREFHEALRDADSFEDLPGNWHAAILEADGRAKAFTTTRRHDDHNDVSYFVIDSTSCSSCVVFVVQREA